MKNEAKIKIIKTKRTEVTFPQSNKMALHFSRTYTQSQLLEEITKKHLGIEGCDGLIA